MFGRGRHLRGARATAVVFAMAGLLMTGGAAAWGEPGGNSSHGKETAPGQVKKIEVDQETVEQAAAEQAEAQQNEDNPDCRSGPERTCGEEDGDHNQGNVCDGNNGLRPKSTVDCFGDEPPSPPPPPGEPGISLEKSGPATAHVGDVITYTFVVTNTGQGAITHGVLTDALLGISEDFNPLTPNDQTPKNSVTFTATLTVPATAGDTLVNTAEACGQAQGETICDSDGHTVVILRPGVTVDKTASPERVIPGDTVTYTYVVTNTGNAALSGLVVTDDKLGDIGTADALAAGASQTFTRTVTVAADSPTTNVATACGTDGLGLQVCGTDTAEIVIVAGPSVLASIVERQGRLPSTGFNVLLFVATGLTLVASGLAMQMHRRRRTG